MSQWAHYSEADPEFAQAVAKNPINNVQDILTRRAEIVKLLKARLETADYPRTGLVVTERSIPAEGGEFLIRTYVPESNGPADQKYPILVVLHGGGYVLGNLDTDEIKCRNACVKHRVSVVNVDYRLAPEHPWPTGVNDSYEAVKWAATHADEISGDISKGFIVNGLSAGANFACVIAQRAREDPELKGKITGQLLQIPATYSRADGTYPAKYASQLLSFQQNHDDPVLTRKALAMFKEAYNGPADDVTVSPLMATSFADLPPAYVQIAGGDPLRDEGLLYTQLMTESGVTTKHVVYPGVPHGFASFFPALKITQKWNSDYDEGLAWLLSLSKA